MPNEIVVAPAVIHQENVENNPLPDGKYINLICTIKKKRWINFQPIVNVYISIEIAVNSSNAFNFYFHLPKTY